MIAHVQLRMACVAVLAAGAVGAQTPEQMDLPPQWFQAPKTASQLGITGFSQSPYLEERDLPPVEERLPRANEERYG